MGCKGQAEFCEQAFSTREEGQQRKQDCHKKDGDKKKKE